VALPETIPVKYTEEEAEYVSVRPVQRQVFRLEELVDMVLGVTGKDAARILQILRSGTIVYHGYRYWWQGFELPAVDLETLLRRFPDADPRRPFRAQDCVAVFFDLAARHRIERADASRRGLFRRGSVWDVLMEFAAQSALAYRQYSYEWRGDVYAADLSVGQAQALAKEVLRIAPRPLRVRLSSLHRCTLLEFVCRRADRQGGEL
jgi:hypothetical protein